MSVIFVAGVALADPEVPGALAPGVVAALSALRDHGHVLVLVDPADAIARSLGNQGIPFTVSTAAQATADSPAIVIGDEPLARRLGATEVPAGDWAGIAARLTSRRGEVERATKETSITVRVDLDAEEPIEIATGIGFFDHMLEQIARHGGFSLRLACRGDLGVDEHHTVEDCALALGQALRQALGDKRGLGRFGFVLPMDEAQAQVAIDLSGRPFAVFEGRFGREQVGGLPTELVPHFFRSLGDALGAAIHVAVRGENTHHMVESCFKATGRALRQAFVRKGAALPSSKGTL